MAKKKNPVNILNQIDFSELEEENIDFPSICKFIRTTLGVTQLQMAEKLDVTLRGYSYWEEGKRIPRGWQAMKIYLIYFYAKQYAAKSNSPQDEISTSPSPQEDPQNQAA